jgi:hypothetical protein
MDRQRTTNSSAGLGLIPSLRSILAPSSSAKIFDYGTCPVFICTSGTVEWEWPPHATAGHVVFLKASKLPEGFENNANGTSEGAGLA